MRTFSLTTILVASVAAASPAFAQKQRSAILDANGNLDALIARHAAANNVPEDLVRRVIKRESGGNPRAVSKGNFGLMQIKLATARGMGYRGTAAGLLDYDIRGEISCGRLSRRQRQPQPGGALLRRRLLLCREEQGHFDAFRRAVVRFICSAEQYQIRLGAKAACIFRAGSRHGVVVESVSASGLVLIIDFCRFPAAARLMNCC